MEIVDDEKLFRLMAEKAIQKFGYAPEHNLEWFFCATEPSQQPAWASWPDDSGLLIQKEEKAWYVFVNPIMPQDKTIERILEFMNYVFSQPGVEKVWLELESEERSELGEAIKNQNLAYSMKRAEADTWPVMNMEKFNPDLPGGHFKEIRNARNKFYRERKVEIKNAVDCPAADLKKVVDDWKKDRPASDRAYFRHYYQLIDSRFKCCLSTRVMYVDGVASGFNGGWDIPNADRYFYAAIGLHNYSAKDLGLVLYLEDLIWIKNAGYKKANMGGGFAHLTNFKNQFLPESWYKTMLFSVAKS